MKILVSVDPSEHAREAIRFVKLMDVPKKPEMTSKIPAASEEVIHRHQKTFFNILPGHHNNEVLRSHEKD